MGEEEADEFSDSLILLNDEDITEVELDSLSIALHCLAIGVYIGEGVVQVLPFWEWQTLDSSEGIGEDDLCGGGERDVGDRRENAGGPGGGLDRLMWRLAEDFSGLNGDWNWWYFGSSMVDWDACLSIC
jgi:hypothetical protein